MFYITSIHPIPVSIHALNSIQSVLPYIITEKYPRVTEFLALYIHLTLSGIKVITSRAVMLS